MQSPLDAWFVRRVRFGANHSWMRRHDFQQYDGGPAEDQFAVNSSFDIPKTKTSATLGWSMERWSASLHGERLASCRIAIPSTTCTTPADGGSLWIGATWRYNLAAGYRFNDAMQLSLTVNNLFDKLPPKDRTYFAYPYYDTLWFDSVDRSVYVKFSYNFSRSNVGGAQ